MSMSKQFTCQEPRPENRKCNNKTHTQRETNMTGNYEREERPNSPGYNAQGHTTPSNTDQ